MNCQFCKTQSEKPSGLIANYVVTVKENNEKGKPVDVEKVVVGKCPVGFTHSPKTKEATRNLIKNSGRGSICHNNPWKWMSV